MLIADDLLLSPFKGLIWVAREINAAVQRELAGDRDQVTQALSELYLRLESGAITEDQFDAEEARLLDRLDAIMARERGQGSDDEDDEGDAVIGADGDDEDGDDDDGDSSSATSVRTDSP